MSTNFLAQLAHRAVAGSDVKPRVAARFESIVPLEQATERANDAPPAPAAQVPASPLPGDEFTERASRAAETPPPETRFETRHTVTHRETIERVIERATPPLFEATPRAMTPPAVTDAPERVVRPMSLLAPTPMLEPPRHSPLPAPQFIADATPHAQPALTDTPATPRTAAPALTPAVAPVLVAPVALAMPAAVVRERATAAPAPAPIEIVIGRIEIRGDMAAPAPRISVREPRRAAMSLDAYLRGREERKR